MIRLATIGTSVITRTFAEAVRAVDGISIDWVYSRDADRAARLAADLGVPGALSSFDELLTSADVDAVYVASPNGVHFEQVLAAVNAGKHVLVEKPAVPTAAEWQVLTDAARATGVVLIEGIRNGYDVGNVEVRRLLPECGVIRRASFRYEKRSQRYDQLLAGERVNMFDPALAGGALLDLGVYCVHPMIRLFGEPRTVLAAPIPVSSGVDGAGAALAVYPGFVVDLSWSKITTSDLPSQIQGESATMLIDHIASPRQLTLQRLDGTIEEVALAAAQHTLIDEVKRFVDLVSTDGDAGEDQAMTAATLRVMDAIRSVPGIPAQ